MPSQKERPIIFGGEMVRAILENRKSQTRRVCKKQPIDNPVQHHLKGGDFALWRFDFKNEVGDTYYDTTRCPYGKVGDRLWVRETWMLYNHMGTFVGNIPKQPPKDLSVGYKADGLDKDNLFTWRSSRFMPKWAARIWLEITNIRVERVQDINEQDAKAEGVVRLNTYRTETPMIDMFRHLWNVLNAKRGFGWEKNPWVWEIEFKRVNDDPAKKD